MDIGVNGGHGRCVYRNVEVGKGNVNGNVTNQSRCMEVKSVLENVLRRSPVGQAFANMVCQYVISVTSFVKML